MVYVPDAIQRLVRRRGVVVRPLRRGFTLLEVMVAVAILGLGLTAIMTAQANAHASAAHARNLSQATGLVRCKMNEIEEQLATLGYPEVDAAEAGPCCEGDDSSRFRCSWRIERPQMPEAKLGDLDLQTSLGGTEGLGALGGSPSSDPTQALTSGLASADGLGAAAQSLAGGLAGLSPGGPGGQGGIAGITSMVMGLVYPGLKSTLEASTRRVSVSILWREGEKEHSFEILQWLTNPQRGGVVGDLGDGQAAGASTPPSTTAPSSAPGALPGGLPGGLGKR